MDYIREQVLTPIRRDVAIEIIGLIIVGVTFAFLLAHGVSWRVDYLLLPF